MLKVFIDEECQHKQDIKWIIYMSVRNEAEIMEMSTSDWSSFIQEVKDGKYTDDTVVSIGTLKFDGDLTRHLYARIRHFMFIDCSFEEVWKVFQPSQPQPKFITNVLHKEDARGN